MEYKIKITGEGTRENIADALRRLADAIKHPTSIGDGLNIPAEDLNRQTEWGRHCELKAIMYEANSDDIPFDLFVSPNVK